MIILKDNKHIFENKNLCLVPTMGALHEGHIALINTAKKTVKYGPRIIDIDIIFFNNQLVNSKDLVIPHYDWSNRVFVVKPLCELFKEFNMKDYRLDVQKISKVGRVNIN